MRISVESSRHIGADHAVKNHAAQLGTSGAGGQWQFKFKVSPPRAEGPEGGATKPEDARRMKPRQNRSAFPVTGGPGERRHESTENFLPLEIFRVFFGRRPPEIFWVLLHLCKSTSPGGETSPSSVPPADKMFKCVDWSLYFCRPAEARAEPLPYMTWTSNTWVMKEKIAAR